MWRWKNFSRYVLSTWSLQDMAWIFYISFLGKHLITYWRKTWADWYRDNIIITTTKKYFRQYCLHGCTSEEVLKNYLERCKLHGAQRIKPTEADDKNGRAKFKFEKTEYQLRFPFIIYADFESVLSKQDSCESSSSKSFTTQYQHHVPFESCIYVKWSDEQYFQQSQVNIEDDTGPGFRTRS